jgi:hypothetical protein
MKHRHTLSLALALGFGGMAAAPLTAFAGGPSHFAPTEAGIVYHPAAAGTPKKSAEVAADLAAAQKSTQWAGMLRWGVRATPKVGPAKSRQEVVAELEAARSQPNWDTYSRLGPR